MITPGKYTQDQIRGMGLNFDEVTSAQTVGGKSYKLDNPGDGSRVVREVTLNGSGQGSGGFVDGASGGINGGGGQAPVDLPSLYKTLYESSGIKDSQSSYDTLAKLYEEKLAAKNAALATINDNPFYSEGMRTGRAAKINDAFNNDTLAISSQQKNALDKIATQKADIETQLNLQTKQLDINNQAAQLALSKFNSLLSSGALDNASGEDIANITRSTGLSSSMIYSAIDTQKKKNVPTSTISFDDGTNQGFAIINSQTGEIISKQKISSSKPSAGTKLSESETRAANVDAAKSAAKQGATLSQMFQLFTGTLEPDTIYALYNSNSKYGPDTGKVSNLKAYGVTQPKY